MWSIFLASLLVIFAIIYIYFDHKLKFWKNSGVPFIKPKFPFGNLKGVGTKIHNSELMVKVYKGLKGKGPFGGIYFFTNPVAVITDLELIKTVLIKDFSNFSDRGIYYNEKDDPLSAHLFSIEGAKWKSLREKMTPTFTSGKMKMMFPTMVDVANKFKETLEKESKDNEVEIKDILARFTTDVIGSCAFGIECDSLNNPQAEFRTMGKKVFDRSRFGFIRSFFTLSFKDFAKLLRLKSTATDVAKFFMNVVKQTIAHREENNVSRNDFMNIMIQMKNSGEITAEKGFVKTGKLTVNEIAAQAFVIWLAGNKCVYYVLLNLVFV